MLLNRPRLLGHLWTPHLRQPARILRPTWSEICPFILFDDLKSGYFPSALGRTDSRACARGPFAKLHLVQSNARIAGGNTFTGYVTTANIHREPTTSQWSKGPSAEGARITWRRAPWVLEKAPAIIGVRRFCQPCAVRPVPRDLPPPSGPHGSTDTRQFTDAMIDGGPGKERRNGTRRPSTAFLRP